MLLFLLTLFYVCSPHVFLFVFVDVCVAVSVVDLCLCCVVALCLCLMIVVVLSCYSCAPHVVSIFFDVVW